MKIAILGAGAFGTALGEVLMVNGHEIDYYDPLLGYDDLPGVTSGADYMILCVSSEGASSLLKQLPNEIPLIVATKGFLSEALFSRFTDWMVLSGPGFAKDIKAKKQTILTVTDERIIKLLNTEYIDFDITDDRLGVLMCGALKNVYAIEAGFLNLKKGTNRWNEYISEAISEMCEILNANGANARTVDLVCGVGDLKLTCGQPSRNYEFGIMLKNNPNYQPEKTVEGITTLRKINQGEIIVPESAIILLDLMEKSSKWN